MVKVNLRVQQRRKLLTILAVGSLLGGLLLPVRQLASRGNQNNQSKSTSVETGRFSLGNRNLPASAVKSHKLFSEIANNLYSIKEAEYIKYLNFSIPEEFRGKTISEVTLPSQQKVVALTFDDGPWEGTTNDTLYILDRYGIKATFFVVGQYIQAYPEVMKKIVKHGHAIGNHTWSHRYHYFSEAAARQEFDRTSKLVHELTGVKTSLFRPPGGFLNNGLVAYAHKAGYVNVMWSADSLDYYSSTEKIINNVLKEVKAGGIILLHDGGGDRRKTVDALPKIIEALQSQGYSFVTLPELLEISAKQKPEIAQKK